MRVEEGQLRASSGRPSDDPGTPPPPVGRARDLRRRLRGAVGGVPISWRRGVLAAITLRVVLAVLSFAFGGLLEGLDPVDVDPVRGTGFGGWGATSPLEEGVGLLGAGLERFDALWYLAIAEHGYPGFTPTGDVPGAAVFFPGLPLVIAAVGWLLSGHLYLAGSVVALAATAAGLAGVHRLIEEETGDEALAGRALVATAVFPSAFFLVAPYTESLFLALTAWAFVAARRQRWLLAGALAAGSALTRNLGVLIALALVLEVWRQRRAGDRPGAAAWSAALFGAPIGLAGYLAYSWVAWGSPFAFISAQTGWERVWRTPWESLADAWRFGTATPGLYPSGYHSIDVIIGAAVIGAVVWLLIRAPRPYGVYALAHLAAWLVYPFPGRPLMSTYRFAIAIAPLPWAWGAWTRRPGVAAAWRATSAALLGALFLLFVNWYYVF